MRVINFSDARNNLKSVLDTVTDDADYTIITRRNAKDAVVMSLDSFNSVMETFHLLKSPANAAHLARSIAQYRTVTSSKKKPSMNKNLAWTDEAWNDYIYWQSQDKKTLKRINKLIADIKRDDPSRALENLSL